MPFMDDFSKFTKTFGDKAKNAAKKSGDLIEISKLSLDLSAGEADLKDAYTKLGEFLYHKYQAGGNLDKEVSRKCKEIDEIEKELDRIKHKILKMKNLKKCKKCSAFIDADLPYCAHCGAKL